MEFDFIIMVFGLKPTLTAGAYGKVKNKREASKGVEEDNEKWLRCGDIHGPGQWGKAKNLRKYSVWPLQMAGALTEWTTAAEEL